MSSIPLRLRALNLCLRSLTSVESARFGAKRCVLLTAQVSTARPDTSEVGTPQYVPGTRAALRWLEGFTGDVALSSGWDVSGKNLSAVEHVEHLALLIGRAGPSAAPSLRSLNLSKTQLTAAGMAVLAKGVAASASLTEVRAL